MTREEITNEYTERNKSVKRSARKDRRSYCDISKRNEEAAGRNDMGTLIRQYQKNYLGFGGHIISKREDHTGNWGQMDEIL